MPKLPTLLTVLQYALPPLNIFFIIAMILLNHAYVHPTSHPTSIYLRSHGLHAFSIYTLTLCSLGVILGLLNAFALYRTLQPHLAFTPALRTLPATVAGTTLILLVASYALISAIAFRPVFSTRAYNNACNGYALMAEIEVLEDWGFQGGNASVLGASSRVKFWREGVEVGTAEVVRDYRMGLEWKGYGKGQKERLENAWNEGWGVLQLGVEGAKAGKWGNSSPTATGNETAGIFMPGANATMVRNGTAVRPVGVSTPVGGVRIDLRDSSYIATYANHTLNNGTFGAAPLNLAFPDLNLTQADKTQEWRYTDHVCLPPLVSLQHPDAESGANQTAGGVWGEIGEMGCRRYRICALRHEDVAGLADGTWEEWWEWVEGVWPVVTGVVAWEVERWSACCVRKE